jgi:predicted transcriptional regulator
MKKKPIRHNNRIMISLPPAERLRIANLAKELGRPLSWVVRDAVQSYAARVRPVLEQFRESLAHAPALDEERAPTIKRGRPPKPRRSASKSHKKP